MKKFKMISASILVTLCICIIYISTVNAATLLATSSPQKYLNWVVIEEEGGYLIHISCSAYGVTKYYEIASKYSSGYINLSKHEIFDYATGWNGDYLGGYNLYVYAYEIDYYDYAGNYIGYITPSTFNGNVLVSSDWIWDDTYNTYNWNTDRTKITGFGWGQFYCPDANYSQFKYISAGMTIS